MPTSSIHWHKGDRLIHRGRPEWGVGHVTAAATASQLGQSCQRLTVRFERAGLKTISTAAADLAPADEPILSPEPEGADWLSDLERGNADELMARLPEAATDPFTTPLARLKETLGLYRFTDRAGSLLDWAAMQTGLKDPLSRFNRHELERHYERFLINLDNHLGRTLAEARRIQGADLEPVLRSAPTGARRALRRFHQGR